MAQQAPPIVAVRKRTRLLDPNAELVMDVAPTAEAVQKIVDESLKFSDAICEIAQAQGPFDVGRLVHAMDLIREASRAACDAIRLPKL